MSSPELNTPEPSQPAEVEFYFEPSFFVPLKIEEIACKDLDRDEFFRKDEERATTYGPREEELIKTCCSQCNFRLTCLENALALGDEFGLFGGATQESRAALVLEGVMEGKMVTIPASAVADGSPSKLQNAVIDALLEPIMHAKSLPPDEGLLDLLDRQAPEGQYLSWTIKALRAYFCWSPQEIMDTFTVLENQGLIEVGRSTGGTPGRSRIIGIRRINTVE